MSASAGARSSSSALVIPAGLRKAGKGPLASIWTRSRIPLIDVGTIDLIRKGRVRVRPGLERFTERGAVFEDGVEEPYDAVVLATGFRHELTRLLPEADRVLQEDGRPIASGCETALGGLYLCGFFVAPTGMLREIGLEARRIAQAIAQRQRPT